MQGLRMRKEQQPEQAKTAGRRRRRRPRATSHWAYDQAACLACDRDASELVRTRSALSGIIMAGVPPITGMSTTCRGIVTVAFGDSSVDVTRREPFDASMLLLQLLFLPPRGSALRTGYGHLPYNGSAVVKGPTRVHVSERQVVDFGRCGLVEDLCGVGKCPGKVRKLCPADWRLHDSTPSSRR